MYPASPFRLLILLLLSVSSANPILAQNQTSTIVKLPIVFKPGYGNLRPSLGVVGFTTTTSDKWSKTFMKTKGVPSTWKNVKNGMILIDGYQFAYQNYKAKNISNDFMDELKSSWDWKPDQKKLSSKPINCFVYVAMGEDTDGVTKVIVDSNNNLDFSDDTLVIPAENDFSKLDSLASENLITINYQLFEKDKIIDRKIALLLTKDSKYLYYNFPQYGTANLPTGSTTQEIVLSSRNFTKATYKEAQLVVITDSLRGKKVDSERLITENEYLTIENTTYKFIGIDNSSGTLDLELVPKGKSLASTQVGYPLIPFHGNEFTSLEALSLQKYRGKYLYLDFWGTWCAPCLKEIPHIKEAYEKLDKDKIVFLGIVGKDKPLALMNTLNRLQIKWPQILSDENNKIVEDYRISGYPTSFLIDPNGIVIAKNLRGDKLFEMISKLIAK